MSFFSLGRVGQIDVWGAVKRGAFPPSAVDVERQRALIHMTHLDSLRLDFVAYGNEDELYGEVARAEIDRRGRMESEG